jgi:AraC family transcriptional regulator of adaptative response / DNA-3-methyladenine glycosylase II
MRESAGEHVFRLDFRPPFDWNSLLAFLSLRAIPGVESVEGSCYRRTISRDGRAGWMEAAREKGVAALAIRLSFDDTQCRANTTERVRRMFDLHADPGEIASRLGGDPFLASLVAQRPGLRVPGCWDGFELSVRAILGQQVTVKGASTLAGRLVHEFGTPVEPRGALTHLFPRPETLADADIGRIGLPAARAATIRGLAAAVRDGHISFAGAMDGPEVRARLRELAGIGDWTTQYVAMRALRDPDAFPSADLALLRAAGVRTARELEQRSQAWRPCRAYAAMHLWHSLGQSSAPIKMPPVKTGPSRRRSGFIGG